MASVPASAVAPVPSAPGGAALTHLGPPPAPVTTPCRPLPAATGTTAIVGALAAAVRKLACEPALYYQPAATVEKALSLPAGMKFHFDGPRSATLELESAPRASELAKALGVTRPVITTARSGAWATRHWYLGSHPKTGVLDLFGPGEPRIGVNHDYDHDDDFGAVKPLDPDEPLTGWISVVMPDSAVNVVDDRAGVEVLARALGMLAADPKLLSVEPERVARLTALEGERFRVSRRSAGKVHSIDVWTQRTRIAAADVLKALGMTGKIEHDRARDSDDYVLRGGASDRHPWRGRTVELRFDPRPGVKGSSTDDPADYVLTGITLSP
jgi:hypothetical protein